jgi:DNA/RNA-binding domain of Phe-tRNA-synthetase-like protein
VVSPTAHRCKKQDLTPVSPTETRRSPDGTELPSLPVVDSQETVSLMQAVPFGALLYHLSH